MNFLSCMVHMFLDTPAPALKAAPVPEWKEVRKRSRERRSLPKDMGESSFTVKYDNRVPSDHLISSRFLHKTIFSFENL
jgi:hypothetical protein